MCRLAVVQVWDLPGGSATRRVRAGPGTVHTYMLTKGVSAGRRMPSVYADQGEEGRRYLTTKGGGVNAGRRVPSVYAD